MTRRQWMGGVAGLIAAGASPASADPGTVDPGALAADLPLLQRAYGTLHPGLYRYQTPAEFQARLNEAKSALGPSPDFGRAYLALSRLTAAVRCGHTYANFFNQSKPVAERLFAGRDKLPFHFIWLGARMVVSANPLGIDGLRRGSEIIAIDDVPVAQIQARLLPYLRADGHNDAKRRKLLDTTGGDRFETFDVFYPLLFPPKGQRFRLRVRERPDAPVQTLVVEAIDLDQRRGMAPAAADDSGPGYWPLDYPAAGIGRIVMPGWALFNSKWDWRGRINAMFEDLARRSAHGLVIDLRDNEGGLDCGYEIIAHLIDFELPLFAEYERRVRFRSAPADLVPYLDTWDSSFVHLGEGAADLGDGFYRLANDDDLRAIKPQGPRFTGRVAVLCGAQNSSATFNFIDLVQRHGLARVYGEPTGGNQRGINGGCFFFLRLPQSGLEADLPLVGTFPLKPKPDAGLAPDVYVAPSIEDIVAGNDPVLAAAVADLR